MRLSHVSAQMRLILFQLITDAKILAVISLVTFMRLLFEASFVLAQGTTAIAPTTGAGSLGTTVTTHGQMVQITGGTRPNNGTNLFHSFNQFDVGGGDTAQFLNTTPSLRTDNILSRVTGGTPSSIFGAIDTLSYPGANFFLMNPAGIVFGPNATLNVSGSVAFTTANYLRLAEANGSNAGIFRADPTATSLLTSAAVAAFGFLGSNPAAIVIQEGKLTVLPGQSISLVGGNVTIRSGTIGNNVDPPPSAPGNQVLITSLASPGEILTGTLAPVVNINGQSPGTLGTVQISQGSIIDTRGDGGGTILIRGGRLVIDDSIIGSNTGDIFLASDSTLIKNSAKIITFTTTTAHAGHITLEASRDIEMDSQASIESLSVDAMRNAGNITLRSSQGNIHFTNGASATSQTLNGGGNSGSIEIDAPRGNIRLDNSSRIFTLADTGTGTTESYHGGIQISTNDLQLLNGSRVDSDNFSAQVPRNIAILLTGRLNLAGGSGIETTTTGPAAAADMVIRAREIALTEGSSLSADTFSSGAGGGISIKGLIGPSALVSIDGPGSGISTDTKATGPGGEINLFAQSLAIQNGGTLSAETTGTSFTATGGSIVVNATDRVLLNNGASITASSTGPGDAGNISINAGRQLNVESSKITTEANQSKAGDINIQAIDQVSVVNGEISTSVHSGAGRGGDITIDPKTVILRDGTKVFAQAVQGSGGNITITTPLYLKDSTSFVNANSQFGLNGSVTIQSPTSNLSGTVGQLVSKTSPPQVLLQNRCVALAGGEQSTFILAGRDALPSEPGGWLSSPIAMDHWMGENIEEHAPGLMVQRKGRNGLPGLAALQDQTTVLSLRRLTPPGFLVRTFATGTTGCPS